LELTNFQIALLIRNGISDVEKYREIEKSLAVMKFM